jgi:hypothetical protein
MSSENICTQQQCFFLRILDSGPTGYYVLELEAQVITLICLVVFFWLYWKKLQIAYGYFLLGGVVYLAISSCSQCVNSGYFNFDKV